MVEKMVVFLFKVFDVKEAEDLVFWRTRSENNTAGVIYRMERK